MAESVSIHEAKTHFSKLVARAEAGEEVVVRRGQVPVAKLVPYAAPDRGRMLGAWRGRVRYDEDWMTHLGPEWDEYVG